MSIFFCEDPSSMLLFLDRYTYTKRMSMWHHNVPHITCELSYCLNTCLVYIWTDEKPCKTVTTTTTTTNQEWYVHMFICTLTLSQTTNFRLFQTQRVYRRQFQILWKWQKVLKTSRKYCEKRRNCSLRAISPFPTVFSKDLYCRHVKTRACLGKG